MLQQVRSSAARLGLRACMGQQGVASEMRGVSEAVGRATGEDRCCERMAASEHCGARHSNAANDGSDHSTANKARAMAKRGRTNPPYFISPKEYTRELLPGQASLPAPGINDGSGGSRKNPTINEVAILHAGLS